MRVGVTLAIVVGMGGLAVVIGATVLEVLTADGDSTTSAIHAMFVVLAAMALLYAGAVTVFGRKRAGTGSARSGK